MYMRTGHRVRAWIDHTYIGLSGSYRMGHPEPTRSFNLLTYCTYIRTRRLGLGSPGMRITAGHSIFTRVSMSTGRKHPTEKLSCHGPEHSPGLLLPSLCGIVLQCCSVPDDDDGESECHSSTTTAPPSTSGPASILSSFQPMCNVGLEHEVMLPV